MRKKLLYSIAFLLILVANQGCSPEVGSEAWCQKMANTPEAKWTPKDAANIRGNCNLSDFMRR